MAAYRKKRLGGVLGTAALIVTICSGNVISQFLRNSLGVIAPDITGEFALSPDQLGLLSGSFFFSFALAQIPVGLALDRYGPRLTMSSLMVLALAGCLMFAFGDNFTGLLIGRLAMGVGCSGLLMGPLMLVSRWFEPARFAMITGMLLAIGGTGSLFATAPLAWSTETFGWRGTFFLCAALVGLVAAWFIVVIRDAPPGHPALQPRREDPGEMLRGLASVLRQPGVVPLFIMHLMAYASFVAVLGLWGGPYLADIYGADLAMRGNMLLVMAIAQIIGLFLLPRLDRLFDTRKWIVATAAAGSAAILIVLASVSNLPIGVLVVLFAVFGFISAYTPVMIAHGKSIFPAKIVGRGLTTLNMATMGGVFLVQYLTGQVIARYESVANGQGGITISAAAYQACFATLAALLLAAIAIYLLAPDRRPSADESPTSV